MAVAIRKLDRTQSFGVVFGHSEYQFYQGGRYFDGMEIEIAGSADDKSVPALIDRGDRMPADIENAKLFLTEILKEGPIRKNAIFQESEQNNQSWDAIAKARVLMGITESKGSGGTTMWRLPESLS